MPRVGRPKECRLMREFIVVGLTADGRASKVRCKYCSLEGVLNATRMKEHVVKMHRKEDQLLITSFGDRAFPPAEQAIAERQLLNVMISHNDPYGALVSPEMGDFCRALRSDFCLPSRWTLQRKLNVWYEQMKVAVDKYIVENPVGSIIIYGWEDH